MYKYLCLQSFTRVVKSVSVTASLTPFENYREVFVFCCFQSTSADELLHATYRVCILLMMSLHAAILGHGFKLCDTPYSTFYRDSARHTYTPGNS